MSASVAHIFRHPIKGIGSEALTEATLSPQAPLPGDRRWAMLHAGAADTDDWQPRRNFVVVAYAPRLAQISATTGRNGSLTLHHPDLVEFTGDPDTDGPAFVNWVRPLWPEIHSEPYRLVKAPKEGMADNGLAQVSILNLSSLRALSQRCGVALDMKRFRGNIWLDGLVPWEEFDLVGQTIRIGDVSLTVTDRIERCRATEASPASGIRGTDPPKALEQGWGHRDFGVYATVEMGGTVSVGDGVAI